MVFLQEIFTAVHEKFFSKNIKFFRYHEHEVEDDVVTCETVQDEQCEDVTQVSK